jgi:hypothetical protein
MHGTSPRLRKSPSTTAGKKFLNVYTMKAEFAGIDAVPKGLCGDVSTDRHLREAKGDDAARLTFFMYEEIEAFHQAALKTGLRSNDINDIFYLNSAEMLCQVGMPESLFNMEDGLP